MMQLKQRYYNNNMSYHNNPLCVPWQMPFWNDIMCRFLNQHVAIVNMLFLQQHQCNEVEMETDIKLQPASNSEVQPNYEKATAIEKKESESCKEVIWIVLHIMKSGLAAESSLRKL